MVVCAAARADDSPGPAAASAAAGSDEGCLAVSNCFRSCTCQDMIALSVTITCNQGSVPLRRLKQVHQVIHGGRLDGEQTLPADHL